jgi:hypothetical protein
MPALFHVGCRCAATVDHLLPWDARSVPPGSHRISRIRAGVGRTGMGVAEKGKEWELSATGRTSGESWPPSIQRHLPG